MVLSPRLTTLAGTMSFRTAFTSDRAWPLFMGLLVSTSALADQGPAPASPAASTPPAAYISGSVTAPRFDVLEFEVEGNTVLPVTKVERVLAPFMGPVKTLADVEAARAALEKAYQDEGYVSVFVELPEQQVSDGLVRLRVLEGKVSRLKVTGARYYDPAYVRARVGELAEGKVPNFSVAQNSLAELNRTEDRRVQPILRPGPVPGTVEAELKVTDRLPLSFNVELNNRQVQFTKPLRLQVTGRYGNLFQEDHTLSFIGIVTPQDPKQTKALGLNYMIPLPEGSAWQASLLLSDSFVQPIGDTNVVGKGFNVSIKRTWGLPAGANLNHALTAGIEYKDTRERIKAGADGSALSSPLRYMPFVLDYNASMVHGEHTTTMSVSGTFAQRLVLRRTVDCFGQEDQFGCKREEGDGSFAAMRIDATHTHPLGKPMSARWRASAQFASQPLIGAEQFSIGGMDSVRGYYEAELMGDSGVFAGLEVSGPNWGGGPAGSWRAALTELQAYAFGEAGQIRMHNPSSEGGQTRLAGTGFGLKLRLPSKLAASADVAWPLASTAATRKGQPRLHARVSIEF
jgi:hemolysin activation/secretion protein